MHSESWRNDLVFVGRAKTSGDVGLLKRSGNPLVENATDTHSLLVIVSLCHECVKTNFVDGVAVRLSSRHL